MEFEVGRGWRGCLINIGIHLPDLYLHLTGKKPARVYAVTSNDSFGEEVEDFAQLTIESADGSVCAIESAYVHAGSPWTPRVEFSMHGKTGSTIPRGRTVWYGLTKLVRAGASMGRWTTAHSTRHSWPTRLTR